MKPKVWLRGVGNANLDNEEVQSWFVLAWFVDGVGFGEFTFTYNHTKDEWTCDTETMSREFVKSVLEMLGDAYSLVKLPDEERKV